MARRKRKFSGAVSEHISVASKGYEYAFKNGDAAKEDAQNGRCDSAFSKLLEAVDGLSRGDSNLRYVKTATQDIRANSSAAEDKVSSAESAFKKYCVVRKSDYEKGNMAGVRRRR